MAKNILQNFSYVTLGRIVPSALQALFYLILAYVLEPALYGEIIYLISIAGTIAVFSRFGLHNTITIFRAKEKLDLVNQANYFLVISSSVVAIVFLFYDPLIAFLSLALSLFATNQSNFLGSKKYKNFMLVSVLRGILVLVVPLVLYYTFGISGVLIGMIIANAIPSFHFFKSLSKNVNSFHELKQEYKFLISNFGVDASNTLPRLADKLLIVPFLGFFYTGLYQFNLQILFAFEIIPIALYSYLLPEESSGESHKKLYLLILSFSAIIVVSVVVLSPFVIESIFPKYVDGVESLQIMIFTLIPISLGYILNAKLQSKESVRVGFSALVRVGSLFIMIILFSELFGLIGLSYAVLISSVFYLFYLFLIYKKNK